MIRDFIEKNRIPEERLEGIGIAVPGIVDGKNRMITVSHVLQLQNITEEQWLRNMPYPCELINDANAAAFAESVMYLGDHWRSGEFGHITIRPGGKKCYCGKKGCMDAYCSASVLADLEGGKLEVFFQKLEEGNREYQKVWDDYLKNLAIAVNNLRMCFDCKVVLGGYVGNYMESYLPAFQQMAADRNLFGEGDYIQVCRHKLEASAFGAALSMIERYMETI
jgi:predicted NBD/HSP70 family sugar kinase